MSIIAQNFFVIFFLALSHEMGHIAMAFLCGVRPKKLKITPLGFIAYIQDFEKICFSKKILILIAGPFVNFVLTIIFFYLDNNFLFNANLVLLIFNLLPTYPLDGSKILMVILTRKIGLINSSTFVMRTSFLINITIFLIGIVQTILFPFNISLILIFLYLQKKSKDYYIETTKIFYDIILSGHKLNQQTKIKSIIIDMETPFLTVIKRFNPDSFYIVYIKDNKKIVNIMNEFEILEKIKEAK